MTLIDSNVILDLLTADEKWQEWSAEHLTKAGDAGPVSINPIIFAECAFTYEDLGELLSDLPAAIEMLPLPYEAAFYAAKRFAEYRRRGGKRERILGDFYVGAHAELNGMT